MQVERGEDCFTCAVQSVAARNSGYLLTLKVLGSNYRPLGLAGRLAGVCMPAWRTAQDEFIYLLRQFAVKVLGAELRRCKQSSAACN